MEIIVAAKAEKTKPVSIKNMTCSKSEACAKLWKCTNNTNLFVFLPNFTLDLREILLIDFWYYIYNRMHLKPIAIPMLVDKILLVARLTVSHYTPFIQFRFFLFKFRRFFPLKISILLRDKTRDFFIGPCISLSSLEFKQKLLFSSTFFG